MNPIDRYLIGALIVAAGIAAVCEVQLRFSAFSAKRRKAERRNADGEQR